MSFDRQKQVNQLLAREIAALLPRFFSTKRFGMMTITNVRTAKNFDSVKVRISVSRNAHQFYGDAKRHIFQIQKIINSQLTMKKVPKIIFELNQNTDLLEKLEQL